MKLFRALEKRGVGNTAHTAEMAAELGWSEEHLANVLDVLEQWGAVVTSDTSQVHPGSQAHPPIFGPRRRLPEA
jgi:cytosine/adenosine deaminase-related metal-dependent hydrolase